MFNAEHFVFNKFFVYKNHLIQLLEKYPDKPWDWICLSRNPNLSGNFSKNSIDIAELWDMND